MLFLKGIGYICNRMQEGSHVMSLTGVFVNPGWSPDPRVTSWPLNLGEWGVLTWNFVFVGCLLQSICLELRHVKCNIQKIPSQCTVGFVVLHIHIPAESSFSFLWKNPGRTAQDLFFGFVFLVRTAVYKQ